jgi:thioredoxin-related protein
MCKTHSVLDQPDFTMKSLLFLLLALATSSLNGATWTTDYQAALRTAAEQNRNVLVNFTGSDWCGWCIKLRKEVFDTPEFNQYADSNLVLVEVDFPEKKKLPAAQKRANQALAQQFNVQGYPTLYVVNPQGRPVRQLGYMPGGPQAFLGALKQGTTPGPTAQNTAQPAAQAEAPAPEPVMLVPTVPAVKVTYDKLTLKGITGSATRPLALINNKTFSPGDTLKVQVGDQLMKVRCESITADFVMVQVDEEPEQRKLVLGGK